MRSDVEVSCGEGVEGLTGEGGVAFVVPDVKT